MSIQKYHFILLAGVSIALLVSCNSGKGNEAVKVGTNNSDSSVAKISALISDLPFPGGIVDTLNSIHAGFISKLTNPPDNVSLYTESNTQSINLGVFGADLAYVISFEHFQEVGPYLKNAKKLADDIGIPVEFTEEMIVRSENNKNNKDSLKKIVFDGYRVIDQTLKQNQRTAAEVLVLVGGWLEGTYLTTQSLSSVSDTMNKTKLLHVLYLQKLYSDRLLGLLNQISTSSYCSQLIPPVQEIRNAFEQVQPGKDEEQALATIIEKVKALRTLVIKGNS
ncbi:MAG: hypothetical protein HKL88_06555 [Bacteroidia bacterium]|jgi:hypothetical protein|nr:hypothetical protein [Bacteroidia bacterium]